MKKADATVLLHAASTGQEGAAAEFTETVYDELRALAGSYVRGDKSDDSLQPTALVHEAYLRLINGQQNWHDRNHFFAVAAICFRRVLGDHARKRKALKRGGAFQRVSLSEEEPIAEKAEVDLVAMDEALTELAQRDERQARVVELRFFGGLSVDGCATVLGVSPRTVKSDWRFARAWLRARLQEDEPL